MTRADDLALIERIGEYVRGCALSVGDDDLRRLCALAPARLPAYYKTQSRCDGYSGFAPTLQR